MPTTKAQQKAVNKYIKTHYDRLTITLPKGYKEKLREESKKRSISISGLIQYAVDNIGNLTDSE